MVKQWVQPPINKNRLPAGGFYSGPISQVLFLFFIIKIFGESLEIQLLAIFCIDFNKGFN